MLKWLLMVLCAALAASSCCGCVTSGAIREARSWATETALEGKAVNPKVTIHYGCGLIVAVDGVEGSGHFVKTADGPTSRPAE